MRKTKPKSIDAYLAGVKDDAQRGALEKLRKQIHAAVPRAEECISYQMPSFRLDGRVLVWFAAASKHCSFYPGGGIEEFEDELADFETSKGTVRFQPEKPIPVALLRKLIKSRIARVFASRSGEPTR
jgi:uncharacterized protein YdhG (YjbR/CyaY superfamily)